MEADWIGELEEVKWQRLSISYKNQEKEGRIDPIVMKREKGIHSTSTYLLKQYLQVLGNAFH